MPFPIILKITQLSCTHIIQIMVLGNLTNFTYVHWRKINLYILSIKYYEKYRKLENTVEIKKVEDNMDI